jgi:hypothetical protein
MDFFLANSFFFEGSPCWSLAALLSPTIVGLGSLPSISALGFFYRVSPLPPFWSSLLLPKKSVLDLLLELSRLKLIGENNLKRVFGENNSLGKHAFNAGISGDVTLAVSLGFMMVSH